MSRKNRQKASAEALEAGQKIDQDAEEVPMSRAKRYVVCSIIVLVGDTSQLTETKGDRTVRGMLSAIRQIGAVVSLPRLKGTERIPRMRHKPEFRPFELAHQLVGLQKRTAESQF